MDLKELRVKKNLTQQDMAEKLGVSISAYNMYENGARAIPSAIGAKIAQILGKQVNSLFLPTKFMLLRDKKQ